MLLFLSITLLSRDCFKNINDNAKRDLRYLQIDHFFVVIMFDEREKEKLAHLAPAFECESTSTRTNSRTQEFGHKEFELTK